MSSFHLDSCGLLTVHDLHWWLVIGCYAVVQDSGSVLLCAQLPQNICLGLMLYSVGELVGIMLYNAGELVGTMLHSAGEMVGIRL